MNTTQTTKQNETLTAGELEQLLGAIDKAIKQNPAATTFEIAAFERTTRAHILAWRDAE